MPKAKSTEYLEHLKEWTIEKSGRNFVIHSPFGMLPKPLRGEFTSQGYALQVLRDFQAGVRAKAKAAGEPLNKLYRRRYKGETSATSNATSAH